MTDTLGYKIDYDGRAALAGMDQLRALLKTTSRVAERESTSISRSLSGIGNAKVNTSFLSGFEGRMGTIRSSATGAVSGITSSISRLTPALSSISSFVPALGLAAAATVGLAAGIGLVGKAAIDAASKVEVWKANLFTVTRDAKKAEDSYAELVKFAAKTPFDLSQSVEGFIKLRTLGLQATEKALMSFGNTAAAMGKPLSQMIEAVADAATGEFERLKEFGIKARKEGDKVKFTFGGVTTSVQNNAAAIQGYLEDLGDTKFGGAMARQMDTISGAMSNVEDAMFQALAGIGGGQLGEAFKGILKTIAAGITAVSPLLQSLGNFIGSIVGAVGKVLNGLGSVWSSIANGGQGVQPSLDALTSVFNTLASAVDMLGNAISYVFGGISSLIGGATSSLSSYLGINQKASEETATWGSLAKAAWEEIGSSAGSAKAAIVSALSEMWSGTKEVFSGIGSYLGDVFAAPIAGIQQAWGGIKDWFNGLFGDLEFNPEGIVTGAARIVDLLIGTFRGGIAAIQVLFDQLPGAVYASLSPGFQAIVNGARTLFVGIGKAIISVFNAVVAFGKSMGTQVASAFNSISSFIERWVNKTIGAINTVLAAANKLGAGLGQVATVQIGKISAPSMGGGMGAQWNKLGADMGSAFNGGFGHEAENGIKRVIGRARALGSATAQSGGLDSGTPVKPDGADAKGGSGGRGKGAGNDEAAKKAAEAARQAAEAEKKYADAIANLNSRIRDLTLTTEQKALADELERAGLGRDIEQVNEKATAIRNLFAQYKQAEMVRKTQDVMDDFNKSVRELGYSTEQLAQVEARRRAGLPEDLAVTNELTKRVDAQVAAFYRLQKAKENAKAVADLEKEQKQRGQDIELDKKGRTNTDKADDERRIIQIQRERDANIEKINLLEGISEAKKAELVLNEQNLALLREQGVTLDRQAESANRLTEFLTNLWENPKQAFKSFLGGVLKGLAQAIAKAALLGEKLGGGGGFGGLLKTVIGSAIGGGRASGGSVRTGDIRMVGENGPELMKFGAAGTIMNHNTAKKAVGGGGSITIGGSTIIIQGGANESTARQIKAQQDAFERRMVATIRKETR